MDMIEKRTNEQIQENLFSKTYSMLLYICYVLWYFRSRSRWISK